MRPNRKVYGLTPAGYSRFQTLLAAQLAAEEPLIPSGNVPVMFLQHLTEAQVMEALRSRLQAVEARLALYEDYRMPESRGVQLALERVRQLTRADRDWLIQTLLDLETGTPEADSIPLKRIPIEPL